MHPCGTTVRNPCDDVGTLHWTPMFCTERHQQRNLVESRTIPIEFECKLEKEMMQSCGLRWCKLHLTASYDWKPCCFWAQIHNLYFKALLTLNGWSRLSMFWWSGKCPIWVFLFFVSPKHFQFLDHSMTIRNYYFYSSNPFKYNFKGKFQCPIQNVEEQEILNTFDNSFHSFTSQKGTVSNWNLR
jgi:hypothetical protein